MKVKERKEEKTTQNKKKKKMPTTITTTTNQVFGYFDRRRKKYDNTVGISDAFGKKGERPYTGPPRAGGNKTGEPRVSTATGAT